MAAVLIMVRSFHEELFKLKGPVWTCPMSEEEIDFMSAKDYGNCYFLWLSASPFDEDIKWRGANGYSGIGMLPKGLGDGIMEVLRDLWYELCEDGIDVELDALLKGFGPVAGRPGSMLEGFYFRRNEELKKYYRFLAGMMECYFADSDLELKVLVLRVLARCRVGIEGFTLLCTDVVMLDVWLHKQNTRFYENDYDVLEVMWYVEDVDKFFVCLLYCGMGMKISGVSKQGLGIGGGVIDGKNCCKLCDEWARHLKCDGSVELDVLGKSFAVALAKWNVEHGTSRNGIKPLKRIWRQLNIGFWLKAALLSEDVCCDRNCDGIRVSTDGVRRHSMERFIGTWMCSESDGVYDDLRALLEMPQVYDDGYVDGFYSRRNETLSGYYLHVCSIADGFFSVRHLNRVLFIRLLVHCRYEIGGFKLVDEDVQLLEVWLMLVEFYSFGTRAESFRRTVHVIMLDNFVDGMFAVGKLLADAAGIGVVETDIVVTEGGVIGDEGRGGDRSLLGVKIEGYNDAVVCGSTVGSSGVFMMECDVLSVKGECDVDMVVVCGSAVGLNGVLTAERDVTGSEGDVRVMDVSVGDFTNAVVYEGTGGLYGGIVAECNSEEASRYGSPGCRSGSLLVAVVGKCVYDDDVDVCGSTSGVEGVLIEFGGICDDYGGYVDSKNSKTDSCGISEIVTFSNWGSGRVVDEKYDGLIRDAQSMGLTKEASLRCVMFELAGTDGLSGVGGYQPGGSRYAWCVMSARWRAAAVRDWPRAGVG